MKKITIGIIDGKEITLECIYYKNFDCTYQKSNCPRRDDLCCVHCDEHFACFTHAYIGCCEADRSKVGVWGDWDEMMWVNENKESHCPVHGYSKKKA